MKDAETIINAARLVLATTEALLGALDKAKQSLAASTDQLKEVLADVEKAQDAMHETLARERKEARDEFDKKFDASKDEP